MRTSWTDLHPAEARADRLAEHLIGLVLISSRAHTVLLQVKLTMLRITAKVLAHPVVAVRRAVAGRGRRAGLGRFGALPLRV